MTIPESISPTGLALIRASEGFRASRYLDVAGVPTIGYGHRIRPNESFPTPITEAAAEAIMGDDVILSALAVRRLVRVPLTQGQLDALVDFVFNLGSGRLSGSTLLHNLNLGQYAAAAGQLLRWDHGIVNGHETELAALKRRRAAEFALWQAKPPAAAVVAPATPPAVKG